MNYPKPNAERVDLAAVVPNKNIQLEDLANLKIAIIHYWLVTWRGGEKVIQALLKIFPKADIYTLFYDESSVGHHLQGHTVTSSKYNFPFVRKNYQKLFPLYPRAIKSLKLNGDYDLVISSESGPAKGVTIPDHVPHLCYIHTPMRYCWGFTDEYLNTLPWWSRPFARVLFEKLKKWDLTTINNVDTYIANSYNVANRVQQYYQKEAEVIHPPVALDCFDQGLVVKEKKHYLSFGALTPYKRIDLLVKTFNINRKPLLIIGEGSELEKLRSMAGDNIKFTGRLPWNQILTYIQESKALLFPGEEDFGIIPLEAMSQGIPVIAYNQGGALETVVENTQNMAQSSGLFFNSQSVEAIENAIVKFEKIEMQFDPVWIINHARKFGEDEFIRKLSEKIILFLNQVNN
jgi:glycosyltransferase involved in cell wall biosynthesis